MSGLVQSSPGAASLRAAGPPSASGGSKPGRNGQCNRAQNLAQSPPEGDGLCLLVLSKPKVLSWFSVAGSGDRHCCDVTSRGSWEQQGQEEEEGDTANMGILLEGRVSRRGIGSH